LVDKVQFRTMDLYPAMSVKDAKYFEISAEHFNITAFLSTSSQENLRSIHKIRNRLYELADKHYKKPFSKLTQRQKNELENYLTTEERLSLKENYNSLISIIENSNHALFQVAELGKERVSLLKKKIQDLADKFNELIDAGKIDL